MQEQDITNNSIGADDCFSEIHRDKWIFVRGLTRDIERIEFERYFRTYGDISQISFDVDKKTNLNVGYAFLMMKEETAMDSILNHKHLIKNSKLRCRLAHTNEIKNNMVLEANESLTKKIVLLEVDENIDSDYLKTYFTKYGEVKYAKLKNKQNEDDQKLTGFIKFYNKEAAQYALKKESRAKKNRVCKVRKFVRKANYHKTKKYTTECDLVQKNIKDSTKEQKIQCENQKIETPTFENNQNSKQLIMNKSESTWYSEKKNSEEEQDIIYEDINKNDFSLTNEVARKNETDKKSLNDINSLHNGKIFNVSKCAKKKESNSPKKSLYKYLDKKGVHIDQYDETQFEPFYICDDKELKKIQKYYQINDKDLQRTSYKTKADEEKLKDDCDKREMVIKTRLDKISKRLIDQKLAKKNSIVKLNKITPLNEKSESFNLFNPNKITLEQRTQIPMFGALKQKQVKKINAAVNGIVYNAITGKKIQNNYSHFYDIAINNLNSYILKQDSIANKNNFIQTGSYILTGNNFFIQPKELITQINICHSRLPQKGNCNNSVYAVNNL